METNFNGLPNQEDLGSQHELNQPVENNSELNASENDGHESTRPRHRHHEDHHVSRKYKIFSNHSSYGDSPHTNTSF